MLAGNPLLAQAGLELLTLHLPSVRPCPPGRPLPQVCARHGHTRHPPHLRPSPSPHLSGLGGAHTRKGPADGNAHGSAQFPHTPSLLEGARPPEGCARGGARSHEPALARGGEGAARRPQSFQSPQAGGHSPVTTDAPRTRHNALPGLAGNRQGMTFSGLKAGAHAQKPY